MYIEQPRDQGARGFAAADVDAARLYALHVEQLLDDALNRPVLRDDRHRVEAVDRQLDRAAPALDGAAAAAAPTPAFLGLSCRKPWRLEERARGSGLTALLRKGETRREVVLAAVQHDGRALLHAADDLKNDPHVVLAAVRQHGGALRYASAALQEDRAFLIKAAHENESVLRHAPALYSNVASCALADLRLFVESRCTEKESAKNATTLMLFQEAAMHFLRDNRRRNINLAAFKNSMRQLGWVECNEQDGTGSAQRHIRAWMRPEIPATDSPEAKPKVYRYLALTSRWVVTADNKFT